ncbi:hypothetical protein MHC_05805 [Mycoplasma haemocanis str. Illinois]|uniref:Ribonuclease J C-terminal domain-containing protein n=1 Tax=Mycoplasma haemocanis (strain Illinois) TaxID=1111676 RepID=H6N8P2_MYCHN|nr:ribonuclease J [Mycoplasma haemocanis]AEW46014.1 hypothetical protein MHC_05805 [Mycoplasma haemocanis str. Illinois]
MAKINYFALGGQDESGRYSGVLEINNDIFILNTGIGAEFSNQLGIKKIIPDLRYLSEHKNRVKAIFIGCPKNLNIGALPYFLETFKGVPVYTSHGGKLIVDSFLSKFQEEKRVNLEANVVAINPSNDITIGSLKICGVRTASSVPNSYGWLFKLVTGQVVVFLDEFLIANENKPCCESQLHIIAQQAKNKTTLLLLGAQAAGKMLGFSYPNAKNFSFLKRTVASTKNRILAGVYEDDWNTLFNLSRVAKIYHMNFHISCPRTSSLFNKHIENLKGDEYAVSNPLISSDNVLIVITGDSETLFKTLLDIHSGDHEIKFKSGDLLIIATITLPENEFEEISLLNEISKQDIVLVKQPKSIVPYKAGNEDIKFIVNSLSPYNIVPIDGYYKDFINVYKALENTIDPNRIKFLSSGEKIEIDDKNINVVSLPIAKQYVSEEGILDINSSTVLERQLLEKNGVVMVSVLYHTKNHCFSRPHVEMKAFVTDDYSRRDEIQEAIVKFLDLELSKFLSLNVTLSIKDVKNHIKDAVYKAVKNKTQKKPLVLPIITRYS